MSGAGRIAGSAGRIMSGTRQTAGRSKWTTNGRRGRNRSARRARTGKRLKAPGSGPTAGTAPTVEQLRAELERVRGVRRFVRSLRSTVCTLVMVAAVTVLASNFFIPVFRIQGSSMNPTLSEGDIVVAVMETDIKQGDLVAFYYENRILVKRCIAGEGQWVDIDESGNVYVDGTLLEEPYLTEKALGKCDIELPYQIPDGMIFVMGDHRLVSIDSRTTSIGCIGKEQLAGKIVFRLWPLSRFETINQKGW